MRVYFDTDGNKVTSPAARMWFYQMRDNLVARGIDVDLNYLGQLPYDVALIHWIRPEIIDKVLEHSPNAHIGVLNPGNLGLKSGEISNFNYSNKETFSVNNVDFFVVTGIVWRDLLLQYKKRVYLTIDYEDPKNKKVKTHKLNNRVVIGYHGNHLHFKEDFFPNGAKALQRIAREFDVTLHVITRNAKSQPRIDGVKSRFVEFNLNTFNREIQKFDIGICPVFSDYSELANPLKYIRNPNRVNTLLFYGIPSITSPIPQSCQDLQDGETVLFAVTEEGWYQSLRLLITQPELRNQIGQRGRAMVEKRFSTEQATDLFIEMLQEEISQPLSIKYRNILPAQDLKPKVPYSKKAIARIKSLLNMWVK
ncbi:MAG: glycosyltransferase [Anaerolineales bacterium]|nr:glycosyltransferase [Anaerolineales bacterium]